MSPANGPARLPAPPRTSPAPPAPIAPGHATLSVHDGHFPSIRAKRAPAPEALKSDSTNDA